MATFEEKLEHACRAFSVNIDDVCLAIKSTRFSLHLQMTGQRNIEYNQMVLLCQYFDVPGNYFTENKIRYIDEDALPNSVRSLIHRPADQKSIMCYELINEESPDISLDQLVEILKLTSEFKE